MTPTSDRRLIWGTALTQFIGWGTLFIPFSLVLQPMEADLGWSRWELTGALTVGLLTSGILGIPVGRWVDRRGGRAPLTYGALLGAAALAAWAAVDSLWVFYLIWIVMGCAHATALWIPAMAVVVALARQPTKAIAGITFITGFTGTVFIPVVAALVEGLGWRGALLALAALQLLPAVIAWAQFRGVPPPTPPTAIAKGDALRLAMRRPAFWGLALCFAAHVFIGVGLGSHLVPLLREHGLPETSVLLIVALHGPTQVAARAMLYFAGNRASMRLVGMFSAPLLVVALLWLAVAPPTFVWLLPFVACWAVADGLMTIVRAAGTAEILGRDGYGAITGALTLIGVLPRTAAPFVLALAWEAAGGYGPVPWLLAAVAALGAAAFVLAARDRGPAPA
ncbi:MFS transporter [Roseococcus pinisoli]|uniref:MFS transporter n=1 Tax=Roseococcus pinisoli TaxID=2835040 RepID=A0ABS5Q7Z3_9PROT|nr:MFS transporter [Roseococcus pinisoli]